MSHSVCFSRCPRFVPKLSTSTDAVQLQSPQKLTTQIRQISSVFSHVLRMRSEYSTRSITRPHASVQITLV